MAVVTVVEGAVSAEMRGALEGAYETTKTQALPDGLVRSILTKTGEGVYQIVTFWESRDALERMRSTGKPKAIELFEAAGARSTVRVFEVVNEITAPA